MKIIFSCSCFFIYFLVCGLACFFSFYKQNCFKLVWCECNPSGLLCQIHLESRPNSLWSVYSTPLLVCYNTKANLQWVPKLCQKLVAPFCIRISSFIVTCKTTCFCLFLLIPDFLWVFFQAYTKFSGAKVTVSPIDWSWKTLTGRML